MTRSLDAADGRWPELLAALCGLAPAVFDGRHQPCPNCGGDDRYRWDSSDGPGSWFCSHCGGRDGRGGGGTGIGLLMRLKGLTGKDGYRQAAELVERHLGLPSPAPAPRPRPAPAPVQAPEPEPEPRPPAGDAPPRLAVLPKPVDLPHPYRYSDTQRVTRVDRPGQKKLFQVNHYADGQWKPKMGPDPWPILGQDLIHAQRDWVVEIEGEKCVGILLAAGIAAYTQPGHAHKLDQIQDRYAAMKRAGVPGIILVSDNDTEGERRARISKKAAAKVGMPLVHVPAVAAWGDLPEGGSVDDVEAPPEVWIEQLETAIRAAWDDAQREPDQPQPPPPADLEAGPFRLLGYDSGDGFYYQPKLTGKVDRLTRSSHTGVNLVSLAPIGWWETHYPNNSRNGGVNWTAAASSLFDKQYRVGMFDVTRVRGRGAWLDRGRPVLHLGDRIFLDGTPYKITDRVDTGFIYQRAEHLEGPGNASPLTDEEGLRLLQIAAMFRWERPANGFLLAGWIALASICGILSWRPHAWLTASAGAGKSTVLNRYVLPLLGNLALAAAGGTSTEAGIRQTLDSDARPVVIEESESNSPADKARIQSILALARGASSDDQAETLKGSANHQATRFKVRSMFFLCSVATAIREYADSRRFAQLQLRPSGTEPPEAARAHWRELERQLDWIDDSTHARLLARTLSMLPTIRQTVTLFRDVAAEVFESQTLGDQYGTLMAGAWCLQSMRSPSREEARAWIASQEWETQKEATEAPDERRCLDAILQQQLRVEGAVSAHTRSVLELVHLTQAVTGPGDPLTPDNAAAALGRTGLKVAPAGTVIVPDAPDIGYLLVANGSRAIDRLLADTPWQASYRDQLLRLPGAVRVGPTRFVGVGVKRCTGVPLQLL